MAADKVTPEAVNFMAKHGRGLICMPMLGERLDELQIPMMVIGQHRAARHRVHRQRGRPARRDHGHLRLSTAPSPSAPSSIPLARPDDLTRPGHIFPLRAMPGGVLRRAGHTEAAIDLARLAGCSPAGVICEVLDDEGGMARDARSARPRHAPWSAQVHHHQGPDRVPHPEGEARAGGRRRPSSPPTTASSPCIAYETTVDDRLPLALVMGDVAGDEPVLVRVHSECLTGDVFGSRRCDCGSQLHKALAIIEARRPRRPRVHAPGGAGHRTPEQAARLRAPGRRQGHRRGQPGPGVPAPTCVTTVSGRRSSWTSG